MTENPHGEGGPLKPWDEAARFVFGAYRLSLSSTGNPCHPRNLGYANRFHENPLRYAVELLDAVQSLEKSLSSLKEKAGRMAEALRDQGHFGPCSGWNILRGQPTSDKLCARCEALESWDRAEGRKNA